MLELKEINFPNKKSVCVRKKVFRKSMEKGDFIKVSNREKDKSTRPHKDLANNVTNPPAVDESELCFRYVLDRGQ